MIRRIRGGGAGLGLIALGATVAGLAVLVVLLVSVLVGTVSWQVVEPAGSGRSFGFWSAVGSRGAWEEVVRLELAARGVPPAQSDRLLADPEERRLFGARNRVQLMLTVDGQPFRWVVVSSADHLVADVPLMEGLARRAGGSRVPVPTAGQVLYLNPWLDASFLTRTASRSAVLAGLAPALVGSLLLIGAVVLLVVPLGVGAAVYLEEYASNGPVGRLLELNVRNLAGVPSVVYGILGLTVFVRLLRLGPVLLAGALTLALLVLPIVVIAAREGLRAVPDSIRHAAYGMGATTSQVLFRVVVPAAFPSILTGIVLAVARAVGEAAPLLVIGAAAFVPALPRGPLSDFTALPVQIYSWVGLNDPEFAHVASAGIVVLLALLLALHLLAYRLRVIAERREGGG